MGFRDPCGFVPLGYVILTFLRVNLFLFRVHECFLQMIKNFSWRHRLQFFASLVIWFTIPEYFPLHVKGSVGIFEDPKLFGQFGLVSSVRVSEGCQVISVPFFEVSGYWVQSMILLSSQSLQSLGKSRFVLGNYRQETGVPGFWR